MKRYKPIKTLAILEAVINMILALLFIIIVEILVNSYIELNILKIASIIAIVYNLYYFINIISCRYVITDKSFIIESFFSILKIEILFDEIDGYLINCGNIEGTKLSGFGRHKYCFGESVIKKIGLSKMYVTNSKEVLYIHTKKISYGISPENIEDFKWVLINNKIKEKEFEINFNKPTNIFKDKKVFIPFIVASIIVVVMTLNPFILYLTNKLNQNMPLVFDAAFIPIVIGTGKQFAIKQSIYGVLNMVILFCMYYATCLNAKYSKRHSYRYIYSALIISAIFLFLQIKILQNFL